MLAAPLLHRFINDAVTCASPGTISTAAGLHNAARQSNPFSDGARQAVSLADAIHEHNNRVSDYSPENRFDLNMGAEGGLWRKLGRSPNAETETFCVANLIGHVRSLLGDRWRPLTVGVSVVEPGILRSIPMYEGIEIRLTPRHTAVSIPAGALHERQSISGKPRSHSDGAESLSGDDLDYLESLRLVMKSYARAGDLNIDGVARAAGTSRRTLQRQLSTLDVSFSVLVDRVRFEVADDLLVNAPDLSITQVGYELGYKDPGSFSRAFKRYAGISPMAYRRRFASDQRQSAA
jgi:AraC-like DNA-binding protein